MSTQMSDLDFSYDPHDYPADADNRMAASDAHADFLDLSEAEQDAMQAAHDDLMDEVFGGSYATTYAPSSAACAYVEDVPWETPGAAEARALLRREAA